MSDPCKPRFTTWTDQKTGGALLGEVVIAESFDKQAAQLNEKIQELAKSLADQIRKNGELKAERLRSDTAVAEVAALREELEDLAELKAYVTTPLRERCAERKELQQRLTAAEQRNSIMKGILVDVVACVPSRFTSIRNRCFAALKPTESGASE